MSDADDKLDFCKQALGEIGTRSTITSLDPSDGSPEAFYCNLFFNATRDQLLRAAHWNFAGVSEPVVLWKALPGTPENPTIPANYAWNQRYPAPPWLYSYVHMAYMIQVRRVREGVLPGSNASLGVPFYSGVMTNILYNQLPNVTFELTSDPVDRVGNACGAAKTIGPGFGAIVAVTAGTGYQPGDYITMVGNPASLMGQPVTIHVQKTNISGGVEQVGVVDGGTFTGTSPTITQSATTGIGTGFTCTIDPAFYVDRWAFQKVILTNAREIIVDYTTNAVLIAQYDPGFNDAFGLALQGKLALALLGDKAMHGAKLQEANRSIIDARVSDGNEGLTIYEHVPDWLQVRGVSSLAPTERFFPAYGPLFSV